MSTTGSDPPTPKPWSGRGPERPARSGSLRTARRRGRGRRGNSWASLPGNLTASVLWPVPKGSAGEACRTRLRGGRGARGGRGRRLRHPAGLGQGRRRPICSPEMAERSPARQCQARGPAPGGRDAAGGRRAVVIGFGVNVASAPEGLRATSLAASGLRRRPGSVTGTSLRPHGRAGACVGRGREFHPHPRAMARAGRRSRIRDCGGERGTGLRGRFDTIDEGGRLVIHGPDDTRHVVTAGEVHFGTAATAA